MDIAIFWAVNNLAGTSSLLDGLAVFLADHMLYVFFGFVVLLWLKKSWGWSASAGLAIVSMVVSRLVVVEAIKRLVARPRPFEALPGVRQLILDEDALLSFPSGHAVVYFAVAFAFWGTKWFWPLLVLAVLGSIARVYVGVHYPSDVLASALIAAAVVWSLRGLFKKPEMR